MSNVPVSATNDMIFALDIGTRSVIGLVGRQQNGLFYLEAAETMEHPKRAMIDGQIEDIAQVAQVAGTVKQRLEDKLGFTLRNVSVAAAGRALKTSRGVHSLLLAPGAPIAAQAVFELELGAVEVARAALDTAGDGLSYYCVGHSVVRYKIDGYPFKNVLGHRGALLEAEIIATFLPTEVVDSLRNCMDMLELDIDTLTLEPIAAMRAVIPEDVRLLNLALVDIGAGTSDIALCADGSVAGYTMATVAGDEITEAIIREYLVDFATAERMKYSLKAGDEIVYKDILGFEYTLTSDEVHAAIYPAVEMLAGVIAGKIIECGKGPVSAVFLVGGGSHTPGISGEIAARLQLPEKRVAAAGHDFSVRLVRPAEGLYIDAPEFATPLGIALTAADNAANDGGVVTINGKRVRLLTAQITGVIDALLMAGYRYNDLMGRNGKNLTITLDGQRHVVRGGFYTAAEVRLNGKLASLASPVHHGDDVEVVAAVFGVDASAVVADFWGGEAFDVTLDGRAFKAESRAFLNGEPALKESVLRDFDVLEIGYITTISDVCLAAGEGAGEALFMVNGEAQGADYVLRLGDVVERCEAPIATENNVDTSIIVQGLRMDGEVDEGADGEAQDAEEAEWRVEDGTVPKNEGKAPAQEKPAPDAGESLHITLNERSVVLPLKPEGETHHLMDLLPLVDIDPGNPQGIVMLKINGRNAAYLDEIFSDDRVDIGWDIVNK